MKSKTNEDLVHDALSVIYKKYKQQIFKTGILPWAYKILENIIMVNSKTSARRNSILKENMDSVSEIYENTICIEKKVSDKNLIDEVRNALNKLNNKEKEILKLKLKGFTGEEIQKKLGLTRNVMDVRVFRGMKKLRKLLEKNGVL